MIAGARLGALPRFIIFYALLYAAFGAASPFLPAFLAERGVAPEELGLLLAASTAVRLISGPLAGRLADVFHAVRLVLCVCTAAASIAALCYLPAHGFWLLLGISLVHAAMLAPLTTLADALAVSASERRARGQASNMAGCAAPARRHSSSGPWSPGQLIGAIGIVGHYRTAGAGAGRRGHGRVDHTGRAQAGERIGADDRELPSCDPCYGRRPSFVS